MDAKRLLGMPARVIACLEDEKIPYLNYIVTFFAVIMLRQFFESYSQVKNVFDLRPVEVAQNYYHYTLAYMVLAMLHGILTHYVTRVPITQVFRVLLPCALLLVSAPLLDLLITGGHGVDLMYIQPNLNIDVWYVYISFMDGFRGLSTGMRIECAFMLAGFFIYFRVKKCSLLRSIIATWVIYTVGFIWGSSPFLVKWMLELFGYSYKFSEILFIRYYLVILFFLFIWVAYLANQKIFSALLNDLRASRIIYYELTLLLGAAFAFSIQQADIIATLHASPGIVIGMILSAISIFFAALFSIMINNIYDVDVDLISHPSRPLITGAIDMNTYQIIAYFMLFVALFYASLANAKVVLNVVVIMGAYYIYSATPLRLKRIPVLSKLIISFNSFVMVLLGFLLVQTTTLGFPNELMLIYFVGVTIAVNFIDLNDIAGDRSAGIVTMPVLIGERASKIIIGIAGFVVCLSFYWIIPDVRLIPVLIVDGAVFFYLINKDHYKDRYVMLFSNINLAAIIIYLVCQKIN